jgi:uncharacterized metal-binding protein YceD (DUF177 family)
MKDVKNDRLTISFSGLKDGEHLFNFLIDDLFIKEYQGDFEGERLALKTEVCLTKSTTMMVLDFEMSGAGSFPCDRCMEHLDVPISGTYKLYVKFGNDYDDALEDVLIIPYQQYKINLAQYLYELAILSIPTKKVHKKKECNIAFTQQLKSPGVDDSNETDPRWKALENFKQ